MNSRFGSGRMMNYCGRHAVDEPAGVDRQLLARDPPSASARGRRSAAGRGGRAAPARATGRSARAAARCRAAGRAPRGRRVPRSAAPADRAPRCRARAAPQRTRRAPLRAVEPGHAVEQQLVVVARRQPLDLLAGPVQHHRAQPSDLAPDAVLVVHDSRGRYRTQCALARLPRATPVVCGLRARPVDGDRVCHVRRPAPAGAGLLPPRLRRQLLVPGLPGDHEAVGARLARRRLPAARWSRARRHDRPRRRGVLRHTSPRACHARARGDRADPLLVPGYLFALGLLLLFEPIFGVLPSPVFFHPED